MGRQKKNIRRKKSFNNIFQRYLTMKYLLLVVIATTALTVHAAPAEIQEDFDEDFAEVEEPVKRNSELLNSLLALPGGIHRSGKRNSELLNSLLALPGGIHRSGKRNSEYLNSLLALPANIHRSGKRNSELLN